MDRCAYDRQVAERAFAAALERLEAEQRQPDSWEEECLTHALAALSLGLHSLASAQLDRFHQKEADRPQADGSKSLGVPFTVDMFRRGFENVRIAADWQSQCRSDLPRRPERRERCSRRPRGR